MVEKKELDNIEISHLRLRIDALKKGMRQQYNEYRELEERYKKLKRTLNYIKWVIHDPRF